MYVTALLMILVAIGIVLPKSKRGLVPFDQKSTAPLRGLLALMIVAHHLGQCTHIPFLSSFCTGIGLQIVAVFFFMSGYGLCLSFMKKGKSYLDGFFGKRFGKLLPVFLFLTLSMMTAFHFFSSTTTFAVQVDNLLRKGITPLPYSWFIYTIFYSYIAFYVCASIGKTPYRTGLLFAVSTVVYILFMACIAGFPVYWWWTIGSINLGYYVALYEPKIERIMTKNRLPLYSIVVLALFLSFCAACKLLVIVSFCTMLWILVQAIAVYIIVRTYGMVKWQWLVLIGSFSLELYLVHGIPLMVGRITGLDEWQLWVFTYALALPFAYLLHKYFRLPDISRFLSRQPAKD